MSVTAKPLFEAALAPTVQTTMYPAPANTRTIIDKFTGTNGGGAVATLSINLVTSAATPVAANLIITKTLQPGEAYTFPEIVGHVLGPADFISVIASLATIVIRASGREVS